MTMARSADVWACASCADPMHVASITMAAMRGRNLITESSSGKLSGASLEKRLSLLRRRFPCQGRGLFLGEPSPDPLAVEIHCGPLVDLFRAAVAHKEA